MSGSGFDAQLWLLPLASCYCAPRQIEVAAWDARIPQHSVWLEPLLPGGSSDGSGHWVPAILMELLTPSFGPTQRWLLQAFGECMGDLRFLVLSLYPDPCPLFYGTRNAVIMCDSASSYLE